MRVIPNKVYDELMSSGILEKFYPEEIKSQSEKLIEKLDQALRPRALEILQRLDSDSKFHWNEESNEIIYDGATWIFPPNLVELLKNYILESRLFDNVEFSHNFAALISPGEPAGGGASLEQVGGGGSSSIVVTPEQDPLQPPGILSEEERHLQSRRKQKTPTKRVANNNIEGFCKWVNFDGTFKLV